MKKNVLLSLCVTYFLVFLRLQITCDSHALRGENQCVQKRCKVIKFLVMVKNTTAEYQQVVEQCRDIFDKKMRDYGAAWRIMRTESLTDQIYIKANRIRTLQRTAERLVNEGVEPEFIGIINYSAMAIIQLQLGVVDQPDLEPEKASELHRQVLDDAFDLMSKKNHDYDEAWRSMRISSMTDLILMKLLRVKEIEDNDGKTIVSEGLDANYFDMINYAVFCMIKINEGKENG